MLSLLSPPQVQRQHAFDPSHSLAHLTADLPEACEACQSQPKFCLLPLLCPLQRRTRIGQFLCQSQSKVRITYSRLGPKVCMNSLCQAGVIGRMPAPALLFLSCLVQALQSIVSHQLQQAKAYCAPGCHLRLDEAGIHQGGQREDAFFRCTLVLGEAYRLRRLQRPAPREDTKGTKTALLLLREQLIAPGNRVLHRLLACWQVSRPAA